ncbi:shikimate kinase [uncultured Roseobacter sp.]|uniref:AAA family ATPase n=1 Tax=uncultured Roseobacter sp. TaxID=114847 RepID=UPI00262E833A|nr:shikimate kinase [uncultured Roseobacter sp.]
MTGLPASGKTTIARVIANALSFDLIDKDDFLEGLYEQNDVRTWEDRKDLSRQSDALFQDAGKKLGSAVLVSHWKPLTGGGDSGTATDWLKGTYAPLIEVNCICPSDIALSRFLTRKRHPSHFDKQRDPIKLAQRLRGLESGYPLGIGPVLKVRTDTKVNQKEIVDKVRLMLREDPLSA